MNVPCARASFGISSGFLVTHSNPGLPMRHEPPPTPSRPQLKPTVYITSLPELALSKPRAPVRRTGTTRTRRAPPETDESRRS
jgi:hypothetical protein